MADIFCMHIYDKGMLGGGGQMNLARNTLLLITVAVCMVCVLSSGGVYAFDPVQLEKCKSTKQCQNYDLSGATWTDGSRCKDGSVGECKK
jgi:hypothetical protein